MKPATTIAEVITNLDEIIAWSILKNSRIGYFATLYRRMTASIQQGIMHNHFEDGKRMETLDVGFANRYFTAWEAYTNKKPCSSAWCAAFEACDKGNLIVLQHLILGINTHINMDLCISTAECCPGDKIYALKTDFNRINDLIAGESQLVQNTLSKIWFPMRFLNDIAGNQGKAVLNFSIGTARSCSWANSIALAQSGEGLKKGLVNQIEQVVTDLSQKIINPGFWVSLALKPVKVMESKNVGEIIILLKD